MGTEVAVATANEDSFYAVTRQGQGADYRPDHAGREGSSVGRRDDAIAAGSQSAVHSGHTAEAIDRHGVLDPGIAFLPKPFAQLRERVRQVLETT